MHTSSSENIVLASLPVSLQAATAWSNSISDACLWLIKCCQNTINILAVHLCRKLVCTHHYTLIITFTIGAVPEEASTNPFPLVCHDHIMWVRKTTALQKCEFFTHPAYPGFRDPLLIFYKIVGVTNCHKLLARHTKRRIFLYALQQYFLLAAHWKAIIFL